MALRFDGARLPHVAILARAAASGASFASAGSHRSVAKTCLWINSKVSEKPYPC